MERRGLLCKCPENGFEDWVLILRALRSKYALTALRTVPKSCD